MKYCRPRRIILPSAHAALHSPTRLGLSTLKHQLDIPRLDLPKEVYLLHILSPNIPPLSLTIFIPIISRHRPGRTIGGRNMLDTSIPFPLLHMTQAQLCLALPSRGAHITQVSMPAHIPSLTTQRIPPIPQRQLPPPPHPARQRALGSASSYRVIHVGCVK